MLVYSDRQRGARKIYHRQQCPFGSHIQKDHAGYFYTEEEALAQGYRPCKRCHPYQSPAALYEKDKKHVDGICHSLGFHCQVQGDNLLISNPLEVWLLTFSQRLRKILIYHESCRRFCTVVQREKLIRGFHLQPWEFYSIADTLFRIHRHLKNYITGSGIPAYKKDAAQRLLKDPSQRNDRFRKKNRKNHQKKLAKKARMHQETKKVLYLIQQLKCMKQ
ncbi:Ada metal-binding domain-containing protein [Acidaminococcus fermentans]|uniref:Ada metal-binding domain-containing protein n=1 Tax=Acidaminococcus fermentans TaxID=905 RepID=UPI002EA3F3A6|nr:Ada metal-binding domain-containing protein [Acidaminococcus fermentans]